VPVELPDTKQVTMKSNSTRAISDLHSQHQKSQSGFMPTVINY